MLNRVCDGTHSDHRYQRAYFRDPERRSRIAPALTTVAQRHLEETLSVLTLEPGARVLELGCGLGRFTAPLLERGFNVTATDISPDLTDRLYAELGDRAGLEVVSGPAEHIDHHVRGPFDAVIGFFFLHHLRDVRPVLETCRRLLRDGGGVAFCEPNGLNPLYYLQVTFTPGMTWRGEPGIPKMRPGHMTMALRTTGFSRVDHRSYGFLPPRLAMTSVGRAAERRLESTPALRAIRAYRVFSGRTTA